MIQNLLNMKSKPENLDATDGLAADFMPPFSTRYHN